MQGFVICNNINCNKKGRKAYLFSGLVDNLSLGQIVTHLCVGNTEGGLINSLPRSRQVRFSHFNFNKADNWATRSVNSMSFCYQNRRQVSKTQFKEDWNIYLVGKNMLFIIGNKSFTDLYFFYNFSLFQKYIT